MDLMKLMVIFKKIPSKGGLAGDFVNAEAQDGSFADPKSLNNANFSTQEMVIFPECKCFCGIEVLK
jgi:hypothetical protein